MRKRRGCLHKGKAPASRSRRRSRRANAGIPTRSRVGVPMRVAPRAVGKAEQKEKGKLTGVTTPNPDSRYSSETTRVLSNPTRIGPYEIERKLGEGGMGVVYAARDERLQRTVALKTLSSLTNDATARQRFWREARAAASVNHPNVCQIYEIGEDQGGALFIAMELLEGQVLADRLRAGPCSGSEAVSIGLETLAALSALHARGI